VRADAIGNLSMWEVARFLADLRVSQIMVRAREVITIRRENVIEDASQIMVERKIGCLPVVDDEGAVIGIVTESDLLRAYQEMLGSTSSGVRATVRIPDTTGELAKLTSLIAENKWSVEGIGAFPTRRQNGFHDVVIKIAGTHPDEVKAAFASLPEHTLIELRTTNHSREGASRLSDIVR
jgi:acetoin utilization protein AcuB